MKSFFLHYAEFFSFLRTVFKWAPVFDRNEINWKPQDPVAFCVYHNNKSCEIFTKLPSRCHNLSIGQMYLFL